MQNIDLSNMFVISVSEPAGSIRDDMLHLSTSYHTICTERSVLISAYEQYAQFLHTFQKKAVGDALDTMKKQHASRLELDAYGSKLGQLEEKKLKYVFLSGGLVRRVYWSC